MITVQGASTAIARKTPPQPLVWLYRKGLIRGDALDYGSGRGRWYGMDAYDPYWRPVRMKSLKVPLSSVDADVTFVEMNSIRPPQV